MLENLKVTKAIREKPELREFKAYRGLKVIKAFKDLRVKQALPERQEKELHRLRRNIICLLQTQLKVAARGVIQNLHGLQEDITG